MDVVDDDHSLVTSYLPAEDDNGIQTVSTDNAAVTQRVTCRPSPFICTFYKHFHCKIVIDTMIILTSFEGGTGKYQA